jgi:hypothetical protein
LDSLGELKLVDIAVKVADVGDDIFNVLVVKFLNVMGGGLRVDIIRDEVDFEGNIGVLFIGLISHFLG